MSGMYWLPFYQVSVHSPEMHGAKQNWSFLRALLSCNDLQSSIPQQLCKVTELGTGAGWPVQSAVQPLWKCFAVFHTSGALRHGRGILLQKFSCTYLCYLKIFSCGQLVLGVMKFSIFPYLARQVYDLDRVSWRIIACTSFPLPFPG